MKKSEIVRRHIHQNPELSFHEFNTQEYVWKQLDEAGITNKQKIAETGIVAIIKGKIQIKKWLPCAVIWTPYQYWRPMMCLTNH